MMTFAYRSIFYLSYVDVCRYRENSPDPTECGCLKTLVLFKPETGGLAEQQAVEQLQEQAQVILAEYVTSSYPAQPLRSDL
jgi:nuclear receptor subfamily 2 group A